MMETNSLGIIAEKGTKNQIIQILSNEYPLTAKKIYERLQKQYSSTISYQGVHKTIKELEKNSIIERKNNDYLLNVEWLHQSKNSLEKIEKKYLKNNEIKIPNEFSGSIQIKFDSISELSVSTAQLLLSRQLARDENDKEFICTLEYGWWPFKFKFDDFYLLFQMMVHNPNSKNIIRKKTPFGEWIWKQYKRINAINAPIGTNVNINEELFIQGDHIIEVTFDEKTKKIIYQYYNKWKNIEDSFKDFALKEEPKINATMKITKNPEMASFLRKQLNHVLEESLK